jgi:hypothetical protein
MWMLLKRKKRRKFDNFFISTHRVEENIIVVSVNDPSSQCWSIVSLIPLIFPLMDFELGIKRCEHKHNWLIPYFIFWKLWSGN